MTKQFNIGKIMIYGILVPLLISGLYVFITQYFLLTPITIHSANFIRVSFLLFYFFALYFMCLSLKISNSTIITTLKWISIATTTIMMIAFIVFSITDSNLFHEKAEYVNLYSTEASAPVSLHTNKEENTAIGSDFYSPSAHWSKNLYRHLHFSYPSYIFSSSYLEIDDEGNYYWSTPIITYEIGVQTGAVERTVLITNAKTGQTNEYHVNDVPEWVDHVHNIGYCEYINYMLATDNFG